MTGFFTSPQVAWGPGAIEQLSGLGARRALVIVDPAVARANGPRRVVEELAKSDTTVDVVENLASPDRVDTVDRLGERIRGLGADCLVVVGGGRTIDGVKAARIRAERPDVSLTAFPPMFELSGARPIQLAAIPTTSGSGSEVSGTIDLWDTDGTPFEVAHRALSPEWALVDPAFAESLSPELVLDGAFETAAQAFEAYVSAWASPFSDAFAVDALATVLERLPHALRWSDDPDARAALHFAATAAGLAASNAQRGVAHALARSLVGPSGLSYGRLLGVILPHVLEFDRPAARDRIETLTTAITREESGTRLPLASRLARITDTLRFPGTLTAAEVDWTRLEATRPSIVAHALRSPAVLANPRVPTAAELDRLLEQVVGTASPRH
jgi:alcohol dehydrogenase class IV